MPLNMNKDYEYVIIIPVVYKDFTFLKRSLPYILSNIEGVKRVYLITKLCMVKYLPKDIRNNSQITIIDEDAVLEGLTYNRVSSIIYSQGRKHTNPGWYYQQFLKMAFSISKYCDSSYYLSWDADTIPVKKISMFDEMGHPFFSIKTEYHEPYFIAIRKMLGIEKCNKGSYIAEHMMFNRKIMIEMIEQIEKSDAVGDTWYEKILNSIVPELVSTHAFSEFETYGTYCKTFYPNIYRERQIPSFRRGGLIMGRFVSDKIIQSLASDVAIVSFEIYDRPPFPWGQFCEWYEKLLKIKESYLLKNN